MMHWAQVVSWFLAFALTGVLPAAGDVVTIWNTAALDAIRNESTSPPLAARNLAILHAAIFDAVNALDRNYDPCLFQPNAPTNTSPSATVVGAAHECLVRLYPSQTALFNQTREQTLADLPPGIARENGLTLGQLVALLTMAWRGSDGSSTTVPYIPSAEPGAWRRTSPFFRPPELPHWPYVVPFVMTNGAQFRTAGPPSLTSTQYAAELNLTKELGALNSPIRTPEQTLIARFWSDFSFTVTPPGHWNQIAQNIVTNTTNTLIQSARLFALLNLALADAGIACWDTKYAYNFWRPITAIQEAALDDNPDTEPDPSWTPLLNTPPFPEYVSGHSTFSGAAAKVLGTFFGTDHVKFTVGSDAVPDVFRTYESLEAAAEEIGMSRIYGGIHFLSADLDGLHLGHQVADLVCATTLLPKAGPARLQIGRLAANAVYTIAIQGTAGRTYILEESPDLRTWSPIATNAAPFDYETSYPTNQPNHFYRAVVH